MDSGAERCVSPCPGGGAALRQARSGGQYSGVELPMKRPAVDYREFRLSRIHEPRFSHLKLLVSWIVYFVAFYLAERLIPASRCYTTHCALDDMIPFCEIFLIPYVFWYFFVGGSLLYFLLYRVDSFKKLQLLLIITQVVSLAAYVVCPTKQELRPEVFPRDNLLTQGVALLYAIDTNTNVCPSMHVEFSLAVVSVWLKEKDVGRRWKTLIVVTALLICASTAFIKQHSVVDTVAALPVCAAAEWLVYGHDWRDRAKNRQ